MSEQASQRRQRLVLYSRLAFYPIHWEAFADLCCRWPVEGVVVAHAPPELPNVHKQLGWVNPAEADFRPAIHYVPRSEQAERRRWLLHTLDAIRPDAIWVQEEPTDPFLLAILRHYLFHSRPRIATAVCENVFGKPTRREWLRRRILWSRLNGLMAVATPSLEGIRAAGMPRKVPAMTLVAGALLPPEEVRPQPLPFERSPADFIIGFVARICEEKGWKVALGALALLPPLFKCLLAGDGPQVGELHAWLEKPELRGRAFHVGLLSKADLWRFYAALDCLVAPSLTTPTWKEQFGGVLADGMAMGLPLIGSDSGSIPEVIGPAGLIVPENDPDALADALRQLQEDVTVRRQFSGAGKRRFAEEFAIPAYARKIARVLHLDGGDGCSETHRRTES